MDKPKNVPSLNPIMNAGTEAVPGHSPSSLPQELKRSRSLGWRRPRILLVEDYPANAVAVSILLDRFGCACDVVEDGALALEEARHGCYDLILMDVELQALDGVEATRRLREQERQAGRSPVPIVGLSAHHHPDDRARCLAAGMTDYLPKPFTPAELRGRIAAWLPIRRPDLA